MASLQRGTNVALTREIPTLTGVVLGARWDAGAEAVLDRNLVLAALLCDAQSRALSEEHFVFFNQLASPDGAVAVGDLGGDQEQILIDLPGVPEQVQRIVVVLYVNDSPGQRRTLAQLRSCVIRVLNRADGVELVRSEELAAALSSETALALGEMYRHDGGWKFKVLGQGYAGGIAALAADYGLSL